MKRNFKQYEFLIDSEKYACNQIAELIDFTTNQKPVNIEIEKTSENDQRPYELYFLSITNQKVYITDLLIEATKSRIKNIEHSSLLLEEKPLFDYFIKQVCKVMCYNGYSNYITHKS